MKIIDTRAAEPILGARTPEIRRQLEIVVAQHKRGDVLVIIVSPSVVEGRGFMPIKGYAAELLPSARFIPEHYDLQNLFRGRCILQLCSGRPPRNLEVTGALQLFMEAKRKLVKKFNESGGGAETMRLRRSPEFSNRYSLMKEPLTGDYYLVVETQMLPALSETEQVDISTYIARLVRRSTVEISVQDAFIKKQHELGRFLKRYYNAQRRFREMLTKALASRLREAIGVVSASPPGERLHHILTNTVNLNGDGRVVFYSEMFEASLPGGALIHAGPFRSALWVTNEAMAGEKVFTSNRLRALPYDAPHRDDLAALQGIFDRRAAGSSEGRNTRFAEATHGATWSVFSHAVIRPDLKALNVTISSMSSLTKLQAEGSTVNGDLVIGHCRCVDMPCLPKVSCQEDTEYMLGFDNQGLVAALRTLGVDLSLYGSNYLLFFLDPEFVVQKGDDCRSKDLLATLALPS